MATNKTFRTLIVYLFVSIFVALVAGCGGGSGDQAVADTSSPFVENYIEIAAVAGPIVAVRVGETAVLDASKSYARSGEPMSYSWSFTHKPDGSKAELQDATTATPSFVTDVRGVYMLQLVVSAEGISSQRSITSVVATVPPERFTGPFRHEGLSSDCVNCHHDGFSANITTRSLIKTPDHIAAGNTCQACHTPQEFTTPPFVDHQEVFGNCSDCHNGTVAIGKSDFHQPTDAECDDCHNTTAFIELNPDGSFDHSNITRSCSGCHNGAVATGMTPTTTDNPPGNHPVTSTECGYCHTTISFLDPYPDHTGPAVVGTTCDSCHVANGSGSAKGQSVGHPITNVDCDSCHSILSFKMPGGIFNHSLLDATVQSCESCHNDSTSINAPAKSSAVPTHVVTSADCGSCHNTESFTPAFGFDHDGVVDNCQTCHGNNNPVSPQITATGKPLPTPFYAHMPTNPDNPGTASDQDCGDCHTPGTFSTGTYDHAGVVAGSCTSCHNNVTSVGKLPNHIPTNPDSQDCADCHDTIDFAAAIFDHVGINTSNCVLCHDGDIALGKSFNHLPTSLDCSSCHDTSNFTTFAGITFNHLGIDANDCASCHNTGIATPKIGNHIPALAECSVCHDSTSSFASTTFLSTVHSDITSGCEGCHNDRFSTISGSLYGKPGNHLPTGQDCDVCHINTAFTPSIFDHVGITGNCASCHNGSPNNIAAGALGKTPTHPATTADCGVCHGIGGGSTGGTFMDASFDHTGRVDNCEECHGDNGTGAVTKKNPGHVPTTQDCSICHVPGTFANAVFDHTGIVDNCASCHANPGAIATVKPGDHLPTSQDCSVCHNTTAFAGARFDHTGIVNNCDSCHDGATARGKTPPPNHVPTTQDCNVCHQTTGFIPGTFDHVGIVDNCSSCHNGAFAIGKASANNHVLTNQDCGVCHNTRTFVGAVFDHTGIVDNCSSCHGVTATGKSNNHVATTLDCHSCHTTATFVGGTWTHDSSSAGNCDQCHTQGGGATFKPNGHLSTTEQCDTCHTTNRWAPSNFSHDSRGNYPGDHRRDPGCKGCHKGSIGAGLNSGNYPDRLQYAPSCAGCHAGDFRSEGDHNGGKNGTVEQNKNCAASGCHKVTSSGF
jgi:hypothetical protein